MLDLFRQATESALSLLGESALLRGTIVCQVNIEHGVQLTGMDTAFEAARDTRAAATTRSVATIASAHEPRGGDSLTQGTSNYRLDALLEDTGAFRRYTLIKVA